MDSTSIHKQFSNWCSLLVADRESADSTLFDLFSKETVGPKTIARVLWNFNFTPSTRYSVILASLKKKTEEDAEIRSIYLRLAELFNNYQWSIETAAREQFKSYTPAKKQKQFDEITPDTAFEVDVWRKFIGNFNNPMTKELKDVNTELKELCAGGAMTHQDQIELKTLSRSKKIHSSEWSLNSPTAQNLQGAFHLLLVCMKKNTDATNNQWKMVNEADTISQQEGVTWELILYSMEEFKDRLFLAGKNPPDRSDQTTLTRGIAEKEIDTCFEELLDPSYGKENAIKWLKLKLEAIKKVKDDETLFELDRKEVDGMCDVFSKLISYTQTSQFVKLYKNLYEKILQKLELMRQLRNDKITDISKNTADQMKRDIAGKLKDMEDMGSDASMLEVSGLANQFAGIYVDVSLKLAQEDTREWMYTLYTQALATIESTKKGLIWADPWRPTLRLFIASEQTRLEKASYEDLCGCFSLIHLRLEGCVKDLNNGVKARLDFVVADTVAEQKVIQNVIDQLKSGADQSGGLLGPKTECLNINAIDRFVNVAQSHVPPRWVEQLWLGFKMNTAAVQTQFIKSGEIESKSNTKKRKHSETQSVGDEKLQTYFKRISEVYRNPDQHQITFYDLLDFVQRFHLQATKEEISSKRTCLSQS